jgi:hypothetical protein
VPNLFIDTIKLVVQIWGFLNAFGDDSVRIMAQASRLNNEKERGMSPEINILYVLTKELYKLYKYVNINILKLFLYRNTEIFYSETDGFVIGFWCSQEKQEFFLALPSARAIR